jgi:hypothetical protein
VALDACHWRDIADEIEIELVIERGVDGVPTTDQEQRVAVRVSAVSRLDNRNYGGGVKESDEQKVALCRRKTTTKRS